MLRFLLSAMICFLLITTVKADILGELGRWKDDVGDVLEEARDDVKEEVERNIRRIEEVARKAKAEAKRLEKRVRKLRDELKGELAKLGDVGKALNDVIDVTETTIESSGDIIGQNVETIGIIKTAIVEQKLDPYEIVIESSSSVLGGKLASAISGDKVNDFLDKEILGDIKVIDILLPIQSGLERIDPIGMQRCVREGVVTKSADNGKLILLGAPDKFFESTSDAALIEAAAGEVVSTCLAGLVKRRPKQGAGSINDDERAKAEAERDQAINEVNANKRESEEAEKYYAELKDKYAFYEGILDETQELAEEAQKAKEANEEVARKLANKLKEAGIDPDTYEGILQ